ncbi:MAG: uroporphyrinogen decarboxylase [Bdellovibrionaceae bacterium]|nr:uroporphyrinogen decarboxylase [Pseudobdellovibrionaceae bacterium]
MVNEKFKNALQGTAQNCPPIWFMRQAGRYHDHYQNLRQKHSFMDLCKVPELAAEVAFGPVDEFDFDVSILFSDLLFPLQALGMGLEYNPAPTLSFQLTEETLKKLVSVDEALPHLEFQKEAMIATRERLPKNKSLIGFVGGPWTLFTYAVEGGHKGHLQAAKNGFSLYGSFCELMVPLLKKNIQLQFDGGAEVIMIFDTAAGEISPMLYKKFVQPHLEELAKTFPGKLGYYAKGTTWDHMDEHMSSLPWAGLGMDHRFDLPKVLLKSKGKFVQGNFDQAMLFNDRENFKSRLEEYLAPYKNLSPEERAHWVCGLGHGVLPQTPMDHVKMFIETVRKEFS